MTKSTQSTISVYVKEDEYYIDDQGKTVDTVLTKYQFLWQQNGNSASERTGIIDSSANERPSTTKNTDDCNLPYTAVALYRRGAKNLCGEDCGPHHKRFLSNRYIF